ncbi:MAG: alpha-galactosidase [Lentisphaeria bacterium]|nr:alpha-galactosidase [Lentisphaeria bacterium]
MKVFVNSTECFEAQENLLNHFPITPAGDKTVIKMALPIVDLHGVWHCNASEYQLRLPWKVEYTSALNRGMPYLAFFNRSREVRCAVATGNLIDDTCFSAALNQQNCTYDITFTVTGSTPFPLTVDLREGVQLQQSIADWRKGVMPENLNFPAGAWEPVFCTWYAVHGEVSAKWVESQMRKVKALGFSTLIVDDGWCYDEDKRVTPETLPNWYNTIGDWKVSSRKFPNFKEHVKTVQKTGLKYLLWVAPHFFGVDSELYREHPEWVFEKVHEGCSHLDTSRRDAVDFISDKLIALAGENGLDGLKIDFLDIVRPSVDAPIGRNTKYLIEKLSSGLRRNSAETLIEFRQGYATIGMLPFATQFRAGDVPFDWAYNFRRLADIRLSLGDGVPIHADPAYWADDEYPENVARHMMVMMLAVPMLSMDVNAMPAEHLSIVKYYLDLYHAKKTLLNTGHWNFCFNSCDVGAATVENGSEMLVILNDSTMLEQVLTAAAGRELTVLNISSDTVTVNGVDIEPGSTNF